MSHSTTTRQRELLATQSNAENNHNKNSSDETDVFERVPIEGTPFTRAKTGKGYTLLLGLYALTPTFKTIKQLEDYRKKNEWNLIVNTLHAMLDFHKLINQKQLAEQLMPNENQLKLEM